MASPQKKAQGAGRRVSFGRSPSSGTFVWGRMEAGMPESSPQGCACWRPPDEGARGRAESKRREERLADLGAAVAAGVAGGGQGAVGVVERDGLHVAPGASRLAQFVAQLRQCGL